MRCGEARGGVCGALCRGAVLEVRGMHTSLGHLNTLVIHSHVPPGVGKGHVHSWIIQSGQKAGTAQASGNGQMDKQNVANPYNRILFSLKERKKF